MKQQRGTRGSLRITSIKEMYFWNWGWDIIHPGIIKYPFWQYTCNLKDACYICINKGQADIPSEIEEKAIYVDADISRVITDMKRSVCK